jgi:hypothetical protein
MVKATFGKNVFASKIDSDLRKKFLKCYIWSIRLCGTESWTFRKVHRIVLGSLEMWCWRRMEKICWTDRVRNEEVLQEVKDARNFLSTV